MILWVIEKPKDTPNALCQGLQGDFPVRSFGSLESFVQLQKIKQQPAADLLFANLDDLACDILWLDRVLSYHLPLTKKIYLKMVSNSRQFYSVNAQGGANLLGSFSTNLQLSQYIKRYASKNSCHPLVEQLKFRYKELLLDLEGHTLQLLPERQSVNISAKEARLLKLFIDNVGRCLKREEIMAAIWPDVAVSPRTIDSHISRLRKHLAYAEVAIESIYGDGYIFK